MMEDDLTRLIMTIPESSLGEVTGELNRRGAWLDKMTANEAAGLCVIETRIPRRELQEFETWFKKTTKGEISNQ